MKKISVNDFLTNRKDASPWSPHQVMFGVRQTADSISSGVNRSGDFGSITVKTPTGTRHASARVVAEAMGNDVLRQGQAVPEWRPRKSDLLQGLLGTGQTDLRKPVFTAAQQRFNERWDPTSGGWEKAQADRWSKMQAAEDRSRSAAGGPRFNNMKSRELDVMRELAPKLFAERKSGFDANSLAEMLKAVLGMAAQQRAAQVLPVGG